jgi:GNAT superfamily N-acetyltransferase
MSFTLRPVEPARDFGRIAELVSFAESEPLTETILWEMEVKFPSAGVRRRFLAEAPSGQGVGYVSLWRLPHQIPGDFGLNLVVDPAFVRQGVGSALYDHVLEAVREVGAVSLNAKVRDNCPDCLLFAERRGFQRESHSFESTLDLATFETERFADVIPEVAATGIRFFSFADTDGSEEAQRKLFELNTTTGRDIPGRADAPTRPFEQFVSDVFGGYWFRPDGQIFAADGDCWIGMAAVGEIAPGVMYNMHTGVRYEYRGRRIALALKLLAIDFSRRNQARYIRTNNDSRNHPMLAINRKLGYHPQPGWLNLRLPAIPAVKPRTTPL